MRLSLDEWLFLGMSICFSMILLYAFWVGSKELECDVNDGRDKM